MTFDILRRINFELFWKLYNATNSPRKFRSAESQRLWFITLEIRTQ
jgi:hypothetical protein